MAKQGKLQTTAEYIAVRVVLAILGVLPLSWAMGIGRGMGRLAYLLAGRLRRTGEINLKLAFPEKSDAERKELLLGCFRNLGRVLGMFSKINSSSADDLREMFDISGLEHLENVRAMKRGSIRFTAHLGCWELTSFGPSLHGHPFSFLVRRLDNPMIEQLVDRARTRFGNKTVDKLSAARGMLKIIRSNGTIGLLIDLNTLDSEAMFVNFFGVPAATTFVVAKLALRTEAPIVPIFAPWDESKRKFSVQVQPPLIPKPTGDEEADIRALTTELSLLVENAIRRNPDQWLWIHRRWKTRPPGEPGIY